MRAKDELEVALAQRDRKSLSRGLAHWTFSQEDPNYLSLLERKVLLQKLRLVGNSAMCSKFRQVHQQP